MLNNGRNTTIHGGTFINNEREALAVFYGSVAPNAILNAGGRADPVRCHPGTRKEVIGRIEKWRKHAQSGLTASRMFWLSGPAGAGKTAIVQTVAESWAPRGIHAANFFFFRTDTTRNHARSLVSTLLYQIFDIYPAVRHAVEGILARKPRILDASIRDQFDQLICAAFRAVGPPFSQSIVLLIDGLDECDSEEKTSQGQILQALDMLVSQDDLSFLVLVGSRDEHQIVTVINDLRSSIDSIFLDEEYAPEEDIRVFVTAEFDRIKRTHRLAPKGYVWPSHYDIDGIVARSSGQFVYSATVMRFILHSAADPTLSLARIQGIAPIATKLPFSQLDAMYTYILSQVEDQEILKDILCAYTVAEKWIPPVEAYCIELEIPIWIPPVEASIEIPNFKSILSFYNNRYTNRDIDSCIADMTPIATIKNRSLHFYHTSFIDYLQTQSRSGQYYPNADAFMLKMSPKIFTHEDESGSMAVGVLRRGYLADLLSSETMTNLGWSALFSLNEAFYLDLSPYAQFGNFFQIYKSCVCNDDVTKYRWVLRRWIGNYIMPETYQRYGPAERCLKFIPYGFRYLVMAQIDQLHGEFDVWENSWQIDSLRSESAFDTHETVLWVQDLLWGIHREYYPGNVDKYLRLIKQWIFWALFTYIPVDIPDNLPHARRFFDQGKAERRGRYYRYTSH